VETNLGIMKVPDDPGTIYQRLKGSGATAGGMDVPFAFQHLVHKPIEIQARVSRYNPDVGEEGYRGNANPISQQIINIPSYRMDVAHLAGVGFIS